MKKKLFLIIGGILIAVGWLDAGISAKASSADDRLDEYISSQEENRVRDPLVLTYQEAVLLMEEGKNREALLQFSKFMDYKDSKVLAEEALKNCGTWVSISDGYEMMLPAGWILESSDEPESNVKSRYRWVGLEDNMPTILVSTYYKYTYPTKELEEDYRKRNVHEKMELKNYNGIDVILNLDYGEPMLTWSDPEIGLMYVVSCATYKELTEQEVTEMVPYFCLILETLKQS